MILLRPLLLFYLFSRPDGIDIEAKCSSLYSQDPILYLKILDLFSTCSSPLTPRRRRPSPVVVLVIFCYCCIYFICMHMFSLVHATQEKTITCDQQRAGWAGRAGRYLLMLFCYCYRFCYCYCYFVIVAVFLLLILQIKITKRRGMICGPKISQIKIKMCFFS